MKWLCFILSHSIFIAICAASLSFQTVQLLEIKPGIYTHIFIFFATVCSYNFYGLLSKYYSLNFSTISFLRKEPVSIVLLFFSLAGLVFSFLHLQLSVFIIVPAIVLTILYSIPLLPFNFLKFTRKAGVLKTTVLALTWTYVTAFIPIQKPILLLNHADVFILTRRFLFMLMLCIIFDNRDIVIDKVRGLHSLATDIRPKTLHYIIIIIFSILFSSNFLCTLYGISIKQSVALQISTVALLITYYLSTKKKRDYFFYYFIVDGLMLFSALTTYIASI